MGADLRRPRRFSSPAMSSRLTVIGTAAGGKVILSAFEGLPSTEVGAHFSERYSTAVGMATEKYCLGIAYLAEKPHPREKIERWCE